jgi:hypothetical protein
MCVILVCEQVAPTKEVLEACHADNPQGMGIAWREKDVIQWDKGLHLKVKDILDRIAKIKFPYVIHFRVASVGGACEELCHPFPYGAVDQRGRGASKYGVLFHNGTFHAWKHEVKQAAIYSNTRVPSGRWSDSRGMAFLTGIYGTGLLELLDEKTVALTPSECTIFGTLNQGWVRKGPAGETVTPAEPGIWYSNDRWEKKLPGGTTCGISTDTRGSFHPPYRGQGHHIRTETTGTPALDARITPWKKPTECDHAGTVTWIEGKRFCTPCGIRLDNVKNEPWMTAVTTGPQTMTTREVLKVDGPSDNAVEKAIQMLSEVEASKGTPESIAKRVKKLCLAAGIRDMGHA